MSDRRSLTTELEELGLNPDALREKYRSERDKRIRAEGNDQYQEIQGDFGYFDEDPYVERIPRPPLTDEIDVLIIGGGRRCAIVSSSSIHSRERNSRFSVTLPPRTFR